MSVGVHETSPRHRVGIKFLFSCVAWMNFLVSFCCLDNQIKNVKNATYYYWSWISLIFNHFAHSASRFCQLTFWLPLLAHFNMQRRKALLNCKQFTDRKISTFSSNPLFSLSQLQFDTQLFSPIKHVCKMDWRTSCNHDVCGFECFLFVFSHNHVVQLF